MRAYRIRFYHFALAGAACCLLSPVGCGGEEAEAPAGAVEETAAPKAVDAPEEAAALPALPPDAPLVLDALRLMPETAQVAVGIPPLQAIEQDLLPVFRKILPAEYDVDTLYGEWVGEIARELGVENARTVADLTNAIGVDPDGPLAFFADLSPNVATMLEQTAEPEAPADESAVDETAEAATDEALEDDPAEADIDFELDETTEVDLGEPYYVVVMTIQDQEKAQAQLEKAVAQDESLQGMEAQTSEVAGVTLHTYDPEKLAYFFAGGKFAMSNRLALLEETAQRVSDPASFRFGTSDAPALAQDQATVLIYGQRLLPLLEEAQAQLPADDPSQAAISTQLAAMSRYFQTADGTDDPWIVDLAAEGDSLQFQMRVDTATHPGVLEGSGAAQPLELATLLPDATRAFLSIRFSPESKQQLKDVYLQGAATVSEGVAQGSGFARQALDMIDDELTIGLAPGEAGFPSLIVLLALANPEATLTLLQMFAPMQPSETYNEVELMTVQAPTPVPLYLATLDKTLMLSNDVAQLKSIVDLAKASQTSGLFAALEPPLDPATPRYGAMVLNTQLVSDLLPLTALTGGVSPDTYDNMNAGAAAVREVRFLSEMRGNWAVSGIQVFLRDAQAPVATGDITAVESAS